MESLHTQVDGACYDNRTGIGVAIFLDKKVIKEISESTGSGTNNIAEYKAVIRALKEAKELGAKEIMIQGDSQLIIFQLQGRYAVKSSNLNPLFEEVKMLEKSFEKVSYAWINREKNWLADKLSKRGICGH